MYIGRDSAKHYSDRKWHKLAENKCQKMSGRYDLGCGGGDRISTRNVICMETYCVCYVQYSQCSGVMQADQTRAIEDKIREATNTKENENGKKYKKNIYTGKESEDTDNFDMENEDTEREDESNSNESEELNLSVNDYEYSSS